MRKTISFCILAAALAFSPSPRLPLRRITALNADGNSFFPRITLGTGKEYEVEKSTKTKRSEKSSESESTISETTSSAPKRKKKKVSDVETTVVQPTSAPKILGIPTNELWGPKGAGLGFLGLVIYKRITTGTWISWGIQRWDDSSSRRTVVQNEEQLKKLNMLRCSKCGYTIFPALGRTFRYDRFVQGCPSCGAQEDPNDPLPLFYDRNDPDDPRNLKADGTNVVEANREYMKKWILADKDTAKKITTTLASEYKNKTSILAEKGKLPTKLAEEMAEKSKEVKEGSGDAASAEIWTSSSGEVKGESALRSKPTTPEPTPKAPAPAPETTPKAPALAPKTTPKAPAPVREEAKSGTSKEVKKPDGTSRKIASALNEDSETGTQKTKGNKKEEDDVDDLLGL